MPSINVTRRPNRSNPAAVVAFLLRGESGAETTKDEGPWMERSVRGRLPVKVYRADTADAEFFELGRRVMRHLYPDEEVNND